MNFRKPMITITGNYPFVLICILARCIIDKQFFKLKNRTTFVLRKNCLQKKKKHYCVTITFFASFRIQKSLNTVILNT